MKIQKPIRQCIISIVFLLCPLNAFLCTTAVIAGKATVDGRPLLLKNRDSDFMQNHIQYSDKAKLPYLGLINSIDKDGQAVWGGVNAAGFAIMNSASFNLKPDKDTTKIEGQEGVIMKLALEQCKTIEDFESLLKTLPKPLGVEANFGVIDAKGGAAIYETDNFDYTKFDVNDPKVAPNGYLISTNFSRTGNKEKGRGFIRFDTANQLFEAQLLNDKLSTQFIFNQVVRSLKHSRVNIDLRDMALLPAGTSQFTFFRDFIPRYRTTSAFVIRGVKPQEPPQYATLFAAIGFPLTTAIIPMWIMGENNIPGFLKVNNNNETALGKASLKLKNECFPILKDEGENYINFNALFNQEETGILQLISRLDKQIMDDEELFFNSMINKGANTSDILKFYDKINGLVSDFYLSNFNILL